MAANRRAILNRRALLGRSLGLAGLGLPGWAQAISPGLEPSALTGGEIALAIGHRPMAAGGPHAITVNGGTPAPLIRLRQGQDVRLVVANQLEEDSSIHWHGLLVPFQYDGVPGISFPGIRPGETFVYRFPVEQAGTYWYHGHSNMQEAIGLYGPLIVDPAGPDPIAYDREHVVLLADRSALHPHRIMTLLKQDPSFFNHQRQTLTDQGPMPLKDRLAWGRMRMDPTDIADVTAAAYAYLVNGLDSAANWTGLFRPGERVRLRLINAASMTAFDVRLPGLGLTVVQADGQDVRPVQVDELQIGVAETYDVIVTPSEDRAYALVAEAADRSGLVRATLAPRRGLAAPIPAPRRRPTLTMRDMGMDMNGMNMGGKGAQMDMGMRNPAHAPGVTLGPGVATIAPMPADRTAEPPLGLDKLGAGHKVLTYADLHALARNPDSRKPSRTLDIHLTANMERYMWSFDGRTLRDAQAPFRFALGERVRLNLINDTMMAHPIHLHGHFFELVGDEPGFHQRKHTVMVAPGGTTTLDLTANAEGDWAFHCHLLYHMHAGMFRIVSIRRDGEAMA
jgi:CopA family copper-resistance protein